MNEKDNYKLKIYIVSHKKFDFNKTPYYEPIQVNAAKNGSFFECTDDTGDNISLKNNRFCELTALYWIWKNDYEHEFIGITHYRRFFKFHRSIFDLRKSQYDISNIDYKDIQVTPKIIDKLKSNKVLVPKIYKLGNQTVDEHYCHFHSKEDLSILKEVCLQKYPEYTTAWDKVMQAKKMYTYNMFVMNRDEYSKYCSWLFDILFEVEKFVPPKEDPYQNRTFGFMSERLFNVYLEYNKLIVEEYPILFITTK